MAIIELTAEQLYLRCSQEQFAFETTNELEPLDRIIGQARAVEAVQFGVDIRQEGYNIFALGPAGTGKRTLILQFLEKRLAGSTAPDDWCYVNNFEQPHKPKALNLAPGQGRQFRRDMTQFAEDVQAALVAAFEGEEYRHRRQGLEDELARRQKLVFAEMQERARALGLAVISTKAGLAVVPLDDSGEPMDAERVKALPDAKRSEIVGHTEDLQKEVDDILQQAPRAVRDTRRRERELSREIAGRAVDPLFAELRHKYDRTTVLEYLDAVKQDVLENHKRILKYHHRAQEDKEEAGQPPAVRQPVPVALTESGPMRRYHVNLLVEHDPSQGAPLIYEDHPTFPNMSGHVDYLSQNGALVADFHMIKPGALHRANGGYLVVEMHRLLMQPLMWDALKRSLRARQVRVESPEEALGMLRGVALEPEPIPLDVKVVLMGSGMFYQMLRELDPEFSDLFKVAADFDVEMDRSEETQQLYAQLIGTLARKGSLFPLDRGAVARVIEHSSRLAGDSRKLSMHMSSISDVIHEAHYWARQRDCSVICRQDVDRAIQARHYRCGRLQDRLQEEIERGTLLIDTAGGVVGQVNGLAVYQFGEYPFGKPNRITARARMGKGEVIDIEREVALGGALHSKGVLILSGFLFGRYARKRPLSLSATLVFEQSYGGVDGDSASLAELCALLSAIADVPIRQAMALTGSVNQHGQVQAIGGVNEKIEGFFDVCHSRGLTGEHGVLIPKANVPHLMLREDVVEAVRAGKFHVSAVETVDQAIGLLTGMPAGEPDSEGNYPPDSFNGKVSARLEEFAAERQRYRPEKGTDA